MNQIINIETLGPLSANIVTTAARHTKNDVLVFHLFEGFKGSFPPDQVPHHEKEEPVLHLRGGKVSVEEVSRLVVATAKRYENYLKYPEPRLFDKPEDCEPKE